MNKNEVTRLIQTMEPKILRSLSNTAYQEQEDLKQELQLKMLETLARNRVKEVCGFWELKRKCE